MLLLVGNMAASSSNALDRFHPLIADWFRERLGEPTEIQVEAWERIASGSHCLISAATGSGKTLAAFLWSLNQLVSGRWEAGATRVLYVSPLKALNNDIQRNLLDPLSELEERWIRAGQKWPEIRVMTRSGDTDPADRRKLLRRPPEILITTPESLNLMLTSKDGQRALLGIQSVILDEIHSVVNGKRGVYLMAGIERLARNTGEFQRIALSATVKPMELVARYVGGRRLVDGRPVERAVALAQSRQAKEYRIEVRFAPSLEEAAPEDDFWQPIVESLYGIVSANRSTLVFVNSRRLCESLAHKLNVYAMGQGKEGEAGPLAYAHHGSLSKEIRSAVEARLKRGELKAIVATNSLEMGIDVGALDTVVLIQCPGQVSSAIQKVGRAGHQVGAVSKASLYPSHSRDVLEAAVLAQAIRERDIESLRPVEAPLDVLAQLIVSLLGTESWDVDELYRQICLAYPYRNLGREAFDLVVEMLAGRYSGTRLRELKARVAIDRASHSLSLRKGALMSFYFSGGVIPDRGYFHLRLSGGGNRLGELDEEFVWERKVGDVFSLGTQTWKIDQITYNDVFVSPSSGSGPMPPFWRADAFDRDFHFSQRIGSFLEWAEDVCGEAAFREALQSRYGFDGPAAVTLAEFLKRQKAVTRRPLPHRHHVLVEIVDTAPGGAPGKQLILHTTWGGKVNRPYALALDAAWEQRFGHRSDIYVNNDCVVASLGEGIAIEEVLDLVSVANLESLLRLRLEGSGFFGARFREAAGTALLVTRNRAGQRLPLWLSRMRSKKLFESVSRFGDFPLILEAWRSCLKDAFDMENLKRVLGEIESGETQITVVSTAVASPFASSVSWRQINDEYMYATDQAIGSGQTALREDLVRSVAFDAAQRPGIEASVIRAFELKRQRLAAGYAPCDVLELREWLRDRVAIQEEQWEQLLEELGKEAAPGIAQGIDRFGGFVFLEEEKARMEVLFCEDPDRELLIQWLSYFGPMRVASLETLLGLSGDGMLALLDELSDERLVVVGRLVAGVDDDYLCEAENFEILLRMQRAANRPSFEALPAASLALFLAEWQGLIDPGEGAEGVGEALESLAGYVGKAEDWESSLLPVRVRNYQAAYLDSALLEEGAIWFGNGERRIGFCFAEDWPLLRPVIERESEEPIALAGRQSFSSLQLRSSLRAAELEASLWAGVWRGGVSNDSFAAVRRGLSSSFALLQPQAAPFVSRSSRRAGSRTRLRSASSVTYPGSWFALDEASGMEDELSLLEASKDRARVLLDRYGVVFRELTLRESSAFEWKPIFKALRLMELAGEVVEGRFFEGVLGVQFVSKAALRHLRRPLSERASYWVSAVDPASLCGLGLEGLPYVLPKRVGSNRLVYRGRQLLAVFEKNGSRLRLECAAEDEEACSLVLDAFQVLLDTGVAAGAKIKLESINGGDARRSAYLPLFQSRFAVHADHKGLVVERGF